MMIREAPLDSADTPLLDRHSAIWDSVMSTLFERREPTVLSWPCPVCRDFEIKCTCTLENYDG